MTDNEEVFEEERRRQNFFESLFKDMLPLEQRQLLGTLIFFAIIVTVGWVGVNEPRRMETFTAQYDGRSIERGAALFVDNCSSCHGVDGRGIPGVAPTLNSEALFNGERLAEVGWAGTLYDFVEGTVSAGRPVMSGDWAQPMPTWSQAYGGPLREDQVRDVVNYVMNYGKFYEEGAPPITEPVLPTPEGAAAFEPVGADVAAADLPAGDPARGEALFSGQEPAPDGQPLGCQACHSVTGEALVGPPLDAVAVPAGYDSLEDYLVESIVQPGAHIVEGFQDVMPKDFGERLDAQSLSDLVSYLTGIQ